MFSKLHDLRAGIRYRVEKRDSLGGFALSNENSRPEFFCDLGFRVERLESLNEKLRRGGIILGKSYICAR